MKNKAFVLAAILFFAFSISAAGAIGYTFTDGCNVVLSENRITVTFCGGDTVEFEDKNFADAGDFEAIRITELPNRNDGVLMYGNREVKLYEKIKKSGIALLKFVLAKDFDGESYFCFKASTGNAESANYKLDIVFKEKKETVVKDTVNIATLQNIAVADTIFDSADALQCTIAREPHLGVLTVNPDGSYIYKPTSKTGTDRFDYELIDAEGFTVAVGTVTIEVEKSENSLCFADLELRPAHVAAIKLAQSGAMQYKTIAGINFFDPTLPVTKSAFAVSLMKAAYEGDIPLLTSTAMNDDADIPAVDKGYVQTAYEKGYFDGLVDAAAPVFEPSAAITRGEAMVMVFNALGLDASECGQVNYSDSNAIPDWAYQQISALCEAGLVSGYEDDTLRFDKLLTREEAAELIYGAVKQVEASKPKSFWKALDVLNLFK